MYWVIGIKLFHSFNCITGNSIAAEPTRLCNNMRWGQLYVSTGESVVIRLKSDFSVNFPGFLLRYFIGEDLCKRTIYFSLLLSFIILGIK